ncbi:PREDICTED: putative L-type lectin-domain containing receptor kinase II.2 [Camelina sativa]|uniref:non-specific serine/threonine protein kinase n=1 Tax=Camelina sativa TaxID=90675 RepID=A0ABM0WG65_CAMSA|nr:PREDICTED: putative L-type lectin-domain containing receptor kinase II.2 [Camelina sativa]
MVVTMKLLVFLVIVSIHAISMSLAQEGNQFVHYDFKKADLYVDGMATIEDGRLKLTNSSKRATGHAFHKSPINFTNTSFSFSTEFVFAIVPEESTSYGQGMAFLISPSIDLRYGAATSYLGIFNRTNDNKTENHILAVELDTNASSEALEESDNHVGIDINSIVSVYSADASYFDDTEGLRKRLVLASEKRIHIWIDYDGEHRVLNVTLAPLETPRPSLPLLSRFIDLSKIFKEQMYFGFSGSTGTIRSHQYILGWALAIGEKAQSLDVSKVLDLPRPPPNHLPLILAFATTTVFLIIACGFAYLYHQRRYAEVFEQWEKKYSPQRFSFRTLYKATKGFKENRVLGAGGFGKVYRGDLSDGTEIAVKRVSHGAEQGMQEYVSEIATMGRLGHRNLVQLRGYCRRKGELLLVYEYMPNGSLSDYLFGDNNLSWSQRVHIIKGVASALHYLHEGWEQVVLHRDIKASNILLDSNLNGKVGDFGLARFHDRGETLQPTRVVGTIGYMAPEIATLGVANELTDVYAFGALILEVVCGRRPLDLERSPEQRILVEWVVSFGRRGCLVDTVDSKLACNFTTEEAKLLLKLGMLCSQRDPENRPTMKDITEYLDKKKSMPNITFDIAEIGIPIVPLINNEMATTSHGTTSSFASFWYDTITVLFRGR